jgi:hypothetical protein
MEIKKTMMRATWTIRCAALLSLLQAKNGKKDTLHAFAAGVCWFWPPGKGFQLLAVVKNCVLLLTSFSGERC